MRLSGPILPRVEGAGRVVDRRGERLPTAWVGGADTPAPTTTALVRAPHAQVAWSRPPEVAIVMLSGRCAGAERALDNVLAAGARVYLIAPEGWGEGLRGGPFARSPKARVLVRRVARPPATAVWTSAGAWLWFGDDAAEPAWRVALDAPQSEALRLACLRLFWHHGVDEGYNRDGAVAFRPCGPRPFDVPEAPDDATLRVVEGPLPSCEGDPTALVCTDAATALPARAARVWCPPSGAAHPSLARLLVDSTEVVWAPRALPRCVVGAGGAFVTPSSARWTLSLWLSAAQEQDLRAILVAPTPWRFLRDVTLDELDAGTDLLVLLPDAAAALPLTADEALVAPPARAPSLRACEDTQPPTWPAPHALTLTARWRWEVIPPTLPKGGKDDPLTEAWRQLDREFDARAKAARKSLQGAREQQGVLAKTFEALKGALLGFGRTQVALEQRVEELAVDVPSALGPGRAGEWIAALDEAEREVAALTRDVDEAGRRAREDKERAEQQAAFDSGRARSEKDHAQKRNELDAQRRKLASLSERIESLANAPPSERPEDAKDRAVTLAGCRDERQRAERHASLIEGQVRELERDLARTFVFRPSASKPAAQGAGGFVPEAKKAALHPPGEALPRVGRLVLAKQRYLAIKAWEDLDEGEREAKRLSATLVADLEGP